MPTCFTLSLSLSPTHLFKFQVRFQVASRESAPSHEQTRGCEYYAVHGKDIAAIDSSLCECWSSTGRARPPPCPFGVCPGCGRQRAEKRIYFFFWVPFHLCHKISHLQACGRCWAKEEEQDFSWSWGVLLWCILVALLSAQACVCVRGEGCFSRPDLSAWVIFL